MALTTDQIEAWWDGLPEDMRQQIREMPRGNIPADAAPFGIAGQHFWTHRYPQSITHSLVPEVVAWIEALPEGNGRS